MGLRANAVRIQAWARSAGSGGRPILPIVHEVGSVVGHTVPRLSNRLQQATRIRIVLRMGNYNNMPYFILTAYPIL
jgi:hypothetical protein